MPRQTGKTALDWTVALQLGDMLRRSDGHMRAGHRLLSGLCKEGSKRHGEPNFKLQAQVHQL